MTKHDDRHHGQLKTTAGDRIRAENRIRALEARVSVLEEAVRVLSHGLEDLPAAEPGRRQASDAARQAHDLILASASYSDDDTEAEDVLGWDARPSDLSI